MGGWGLTSCPHPPGEEGDLCHPGQLQHGHHGPDHMMSTRDSLSIKPTIQLAALSSLCPSLQPPRGSCFLSVLFGVLPWEAQQILQGCGSPGSQIPNPLPFPDPPRARALPQHLFITPGAGQAVWFGIKHSLAGLLPATTVAHGCLISHDRPFPRALGAGLPSLAPEGVCPGMGVGGRQQHQPGLIIQDVPRSWVGRVAVAGDGAGSREIAPGWMRRGNLCWESWGREQLLGTVATGKSGYQIPSRRKLLRNQLSLRRGTKSALQHAKKCSEAPKHFGGDWPSKALAWPLTGMRTLCWGHEVSSWQLGGDAHGAGDGLPLPLFCPVESMEGLFPAQQQHHQSAPPPGQPRHLQEMPWSGRQCWQHGRELPPAQEFELHAQPLFCTVVLQHPLHKAGAGLLPW